MLPCFIHNQNAILHVKVMVKCSKKFQISPHYPGGGSKKVMDFFDNFGTFLVLNDSLCFPRLRAGAFESESSGKRSVRNGMEHQARIVVVGTLVIYRLPSDVDYIMLRPGW